MIVRALRSLGLLCGLLLLGACAARGPTGPEANVDPLALDALAERYVRLVLALGVHDEISVDAYYGPTPWRTAAQQEALPLDAIERATAELGVALDALGDPGDEALRARQRYLAAQVLALNTRTQQLQGRQFTFDEEARLLYGVTPPHYREADFEAPLAALERLLPGEGPLAARYQDFTARFDVPPAQLESLMRFAIDEARRRTRAHMTLPADEHFELELVSDQSWSAYNWYQGGYLSRIQINTDHPVGVRGVMALAAHEGYPGHHVYNALLESNLVRGRGWIEFSVYALFSPQSLIGEGSADLGASLAFGGSDYTRFERMLMQRAGLPLADADRYDQVMAQVYALRGVPIEVARRYLDGALTREEALHWLQRYALLSPARAEQRLAFIERYRSYLINYSYGQQLVREWLRRSWWARFSNSARWQGFGELLAEPHTPADLLKP